MDRPEPMKPTTKPQGEVRPIIAQAEKESSCEDLLEKILERENLNAAWKRVKQNGGAAGIDGMEIAAFRDFLAEHRDTILGKAAPRRRQLCPSPVRRVEIPKPDGTKRPLGIPTVLDRIIQQAIAQILTPIYDPVSATTAMDFVRHAVPTTQFGRCSGNRKRSEGNGSSIAI